MSHAMLRTAVRGLGHDCVEAQDGMEAWDIRRQHQPDIVVGNWQMSDLDGPALCRRVRTWAMNLSEPPTRDDFVAFARPLRQYLVAMSQRRGVHGQPNATKLLGGSRRRSTRCEDAPD